MKDNVATEQHPIRSRPAWQLVRMMRDVGVTQAVIAKRCGVQRPYVSMVIRRRASIRPTKKTEAIWRAIERALKGVA